MRLAQVLDAEFDPAWHCFIDAERQASAAGGLMGGGQLTNPVREAPSAAHRTTQADHGTTRADHGTECTAHAALDKKRVSEHIYHHKLHVFANRTHSPNYAPYTNAVMMNVTLSLCGHRPDDTSVAGGQLAAAASSRSVAALHVQSPEKMLMHNVAELHARFHKPSS